ncbi:hypothetical protein BROC_00824 [Candidatus Brocadiaceae bacterium]|nr:hypothetical protein BROC_00824 [Candidatus Brocadiaceae bacterium]
MNKPKFKAAVQLFLLAAATLILFLFDPSSETVYLPCWFYEVTGWYCPGCGGLRGTHDILHGDFLQALKSNLLLVVSLPLISYFAVSRILFIARGKGLPEIQAPPWLVWLAVLFVIGFTVLRNIPAPEFDWMRP